MRYETSWMEREDGKLIKIVTEDDFPMFLPLKYLTQMVNKKLSPFTIRNAAHHIANFIQWMDSQGWQFADVTDNHPNLYLRHLLKLGLKPRTVRLKMGVVLSFLRWCSEPAQGTPLLQRAVPVRRTRGWSVSSKLGMRTPRHGGMLAEMVRPSFHMVWNDVPKVPKQLPKDISDEQLDKVRAWINTTFSERYEAPRRYLYRAIWEMLWDGALRRGELLNLRVDSFDFKEGTVTVPNLEDDDKPDPTWLTKKIGPRLKTGSRVITPSETTMQWVYQWYLHFRPTEAHKRGEGRMFVHVGRQDRDRDPRRGTPLTISALDWMFSLVRRSEDEGGAGVNVTPHMLRHTWATMALRGGASTKTIQWYLGHASESSTHIYLHIGDKETRESLEEYRRRHAHRYAMPN